MFIFPADWLASFIWLAGSMSLRAGARLSLFNLISFVSRRNPLAQMEEERREHEAKMKKMEQEMEQVFDMKVKEKTQKLKDSEADVSHAYFMPCERSVS